MQHSTNKRLGQHFLHNPFVIDQILQVLGFSQQDKFVEIGPGLGAITKPLLKYLDCLIGIEIDKKLQVPLMNLPGAQKKLILICADALTINYSQWGSQLRIVGNLPYNISTPLLFYLLNYINFIKDMHFMLQKEVVLRLVAQPGNKNYGRLSIMLQYFCEIDYLFDIAASSFYPKPKVSSAMIRLQPYELSPFPSVNTRKLQFIVAQAFSMRRKTLANNLRQIISPTSLIQLSIDPSCRPEQLTIKDYVKIALAS